MRQYEITYLISDDVTDSEINKLTGKISGIVSAAKGKVLKEESLGRRKLAYPIDKREFATFVTINFEIDPEVINAVSKEIRTMKEVVRLLALIVEAKKAKAILTTEDVEDAAKISDVIGGEKSFEAILGRTEESYDLMAKRETEEHKNERTEEKELTDEPKKIEEPTEKQDIKEKPKTAKKTVAKKEAVKAPETKESTPEIKVAPKKVTVKKKAVPKKKVDSKTNDEADRLSKLDKELDDLLGDDL